ncbi:hypothetical protein XELAEV_18046158mg, partial [Xenopus laevis]
ETHSIMSSPVKSDSFLMDYKLLAVQGYSFRSSPRKMTAYDQHECIKNLRNPNKSLRDRNRAGCLPAVCNHTLCAV